jgi:geranylgeranyl diphosphate synthase type II
MDLQLINDDLKRSLKSPESTRAFFDVLEWATFPAGKLFRPRLVLALAQDQGGITADHRHLAAAIELHHAYTLVHDDLPAMDNDLIRRGKASTHAQFGEWKAILAGDALLIQSFSELAKIKHNELPTLLKLMTWTTGAKGLIFGQYLDLEAKPKKFKDIVRIHELKTARLIQLALTGSHLISTGEFSREYMRLGSKLGVSFQLIDDLTELASSELSDHEKEINPFLKWPGESFSYLLKNILYIKQNLKENQLKSLFQEVYLYLHSMTKIISENQKIILSHSSTKEFKSGLEQLVVDLTSGEKI